jgi:SNF2 family DNA or RNA helicase
MQGHEDVPYRTHVIERGVFDAWTRTPQLEPHLEASFNNSLVGFIHADRLLKIRNTIISRPRISPENLIELGSSVASEDRQLRQQFLESQKSACRKAGRKSSAHHDDSNATIMAENAAKRARDPSTLKEMKKELDVAIARLDNAEDEDLLMRSSNSTESYGIPISLSATSLLGKTRLRSSTSSKLNYIINEVCNSPTYLSLNEFSSQQCCQVLQYAPSDKILIFSDSELSLAHLAEALDLIYVKYLRFTTQIDPRVREQMVLTFETSETYRVFLMELKHGARGL